MRPAASTRRATGRARGLVLLAAWALSAGCDTRPGSASAWNRPAGDGLAILGAALSRGTDYVDARGRVSRAPAYGKDEVAGYVEYGATDWLMLIARPSFDRIAIGAPGQGRYTGLGGTSAGAQLRALAYGPAVLAVQGSFGLPGRGSRDNPALIGNTAREGEVRLLGGIGFALGGYVGFVDAQQGLRIRSGGGAAQWHSDLTFGLRPSPTWLVMLRSETVVPTGPGTPWLPSARSSRLGVAAVHDFTGAVSLELGLSTTVWGRAALRERGLRTAIWYRF